MIKKGQTNKIEIDIQVTFCIKFSCASAFLSIPAKEIWKGMVDRTAKLLLVCLFIFSCYLFLRYRWISYILLSYIGWIAYDNIKSSFIAFKDLNKGNIPNKGNILYRYYCRAGIFNLFKFNF